MGQIRMQEAESALKPSSHPDNIEAMSQPGKKPRLSMKFLQDLIRELQHENLMLAMRVECLEEQLSEVLDDSTLTKRIERLEKQLGEWNQVHRETAAALELPDTTDAVDMPAELPPVPASDAPQQTLPAVVAPQPIRTPRSERHQTQKKKKPFWASWFRLHTS